MDASRWQQVQELFEGALARPTAQRAAWLESQCGDDESLRTEVDGLLRADAEAGQSIVEAVQGGQELLLGERPTGDTVAGPLGPPKSNPDSGDVDSAAITALSPGGGRFATPPVDAEGRTRFGRYTVDAWIGQGGFGVVYRGHDPVLKRRVAIKTCTGLDADLRRRFFREGQIAAGLQHPNIVTVHELGVESGVPYMVQEFLDGDDLRQLVPKHAELPLERRLRILYEVARGLDHAHRAGVLHRDVKPANIRILADGSVKILDFGIAKLLDAESQLTGTGTTLGTVGYLAPEQLRSEPIDARADIFSFGVVAYELLTGQRPFRGQDFSQVSYQLLFVEPEPVSQSWPGCPAALVELVNQCLAKERDGRPADFGAIVTRLEGLLDQERSGGTLAVADPVLPTPPPAEDPGSAEATGSSAVEVATASRGAGGRGSWLLAVGGLAVALVAGFWWQGSQGDGAPVPEPVQVAMNTSLGSSPTTADPASGGGLLDGTDGAASAATNDPLTPGEGSADLSGADDSGTDDGALQNGIEDGTEAQDEGGGAPTRDADSAGPIAAAESTAAPPGAGTTAGEGVSSAGSSPGDTTTADLLGLDSGSTQPPSPGLGEGDGGDADADAGAGGSSGLPVESSDPADGPSADGVGGTPFGNGGGGPGGSGAAASDSSETVAGAADPSEVQAESDPGTEGAIVRGAFLVEGPGVTPPRLLGEFEPVYPRRARRRGIEQRVVVKVLVDEDGRVLQAIVPGDEHGFGEAARQAALRARFAPATQDGVAGKMWMNLPFEFRLRN